MKKLITGRPPKSGETRKPITLRLTPTTIDRIKSLAKNLGCSQSDVVENLLNE